MTTIAPRPKSSKIFNNDIEMDFKKPFGLDPCTENNIFYNLDQTLTDPSENYFSPYAKSPKQIKKYSKTR